MSTATLTPAHIQVDPAADFRYQRHLHGYPRWLADTFGVVLLGVIVVLLLGYHPYAEDGGIYFAGVAAKVDPSLYAYGHAWVEAQMHYGQFATAAAALARAFGGNVEVALFLLFVGSVFALLAAALHLARTCVGRCAAAWWGVACLAVGAGLPVAGTSLYGVDPYCCARSLAAPCLLLAWSLLLRRRFKAGLPMVALAAAMHPLMAVWGALPLCFAWAWQQRRRSLALQVIVLPALLAAWVAYEISSPDTPLLHCLSTLRAYWFLSQWHGYEWFGAVAPALLLLWMARGTPRTSATRTLAASAGLTTLLALVLALLFARVDAPTSVVARLQPLRALHLVFLALFVMLSARCGRWLHRPGRRVVGLLVLGVAACSVFAMQRDLYGSTRHLELPGLRSGNDWEEAFLWVRQHTLPQDVVALDADYIGARGNDAEGFRAAARRSTLPDRAKDGGIASVMPSLAVEWLAGVHATEHLNTESDAERSQGLQAFPVRWLVLAQPVHTTFACPFHNRSVAVCRLH